MLKTLEGILAFAAGMVVTTVVAVNLLAWGYVAPVEMHIYALHDNGVVHEYVNYFWELEDCLFARDQLWADNIVDIRCY